MSDTLGLPKGPARTFQPGDLIATKYRLEHELGRGAMGTVWAATHATLGQKVAIKLIASDQSHSQEARRRFSLEAKAAARLKSRHAVQVYDDGETPDGVPYIVMEYLEGETLETRLDRQGDLGLPEAVRITTHVGRALARAHARGIVHRDLKSGNVFIARTDDDDLGWIAKVLDFGVAKLADMPNAATTKTGTILGTPLFMSPEQIRGASHVDQRADLYSLGMVFYNMVTGGYAFDGPSYSDVLVAICTEELPPIREKAPWLPEAIGAWFGRACALEPADRFQSADEMLEALREAAGSQGRLSRPSVAEEISGPSGTLVGHQPPHAVSIVGASEPATDGPSNSPHSERMLGSSAGPALRTTEHAPSELGAPGTQRTRGSLGRYAALAGAGAGLALLLVVANAALSETTDPDPPHELHVEPAAPAPWIPPVPRLEPSAAAPPPDLDASVGGSPRSVRARPLGSPAPKSVASSAPAQTAPPSPPRAPTPDMGF